VEVDLASDVAEMALVSLDVSAASSVSISTGSLAFSAGDFGGDFGDFGGGGLVFVLEFVDVRVGGGDLVMSVCSLSTCSAWS
jgi:hypothetical protein